MLLLTWAALGGLAPFIAAFALGTLRRTHARWKYTSSTGRRRGWLYYVVPLGTYVLCLVVASAIFSRWVAEVHSRGDALVGLVIGAVAVVLHVRLAIRFAGRQARRYL